MSLNKIVIPKKRIKKGLVGTNKKKGAICNLKVWIKLVTIGRRSMSVCGARTGVQRRIQELEKFVKLQTARGMERDKKKK